VISNPGEMTMTPDELKAFHDKIHTGPIADRLAQAEQIIASLNFEALPGCIAQLELLQRLATGLETEIAYNTSKEPTPA
jgi:hypothetical protein